MLLATKRLLLSMLRPAGRRTAVRMESRLEVHLGCGLERLGGAVQRVLEPFRERGFELWARAEADEEFRPLLENDPLLHDRFFLLALPRAKGSRRITP